MKEIFESLLGVFCLILLITSSMSVIAAAIDFKNADADKTAYIAEMENSNFSNTVVTNVYNQATADGYTVFMKIYHRPTGGGGNFITEVNPYTPTVGDTSDVYMIRIQMSYEYSFPFLNSVIPHVLIGYAR